MELLALLLVLGWGEAVASPVRGRWGGGAGGEENGPSGARKRGREGREAWVLAEEGFDR